MNELVFLKKKTPLRTRLFIRVNAFLNMCISEMNIFLEKLKGRMNPFLESKLFRTLFGLLIFVNPIAVSPQLYTVFTAPTVEGISAATFGIFAILQGFFVCYAIQKVDWRIFLALSLGFTENVMIAATVLLRGGSFL